MLAAPSVTVCGEFFIHVICVISATNLSTSCYYLHFREEETCSER